MTVCAEIEYGPGIHSDICPPGCDIARVDEPCGDDGETYRSFLHDCLDEWLDNSNGTGIFYIKNADEERTTR